MFDITPPRALSKKRQLPFLKKTKYEGGGRQAGGHSRAHCGQNLRPLI